MTLTPLYYTDAHSSIVSRRECLFSPDFREKNKLGERSVAIIGCTYVFTDSILRAELHNGIRQLTFCDTSAEKAQAYLSMAGQAAERICPTHRPRLHSRTRIAEAVKDADTVYVGLGPSYTATQRVLDTYHRHGVFVTIGDTLYSPGLIQWLLEYNALVEIREAVHALASPDCVIFASANPLPEVTGLLAGGAEAAPVFGFCCGAKDLRRLFEGYLEAEPASLTVEYAARNHLGVVRVFDAWGRNVLPALLERLHPDRLRDTIQRGGPEAEQARADWPLAVIMHHYYDAQAGATIVSESGVHGLEYLPRLFQAANRQVLPPADEWEHDIFRRMAKTEDNRARLLADPLGYEQHTAWAVGRFDPWSQVLRQLREDPELTDKDLRHWGPAYVNVVNGDLFPELPPGAVVEAPTTYDDGRMYVYRNSVPLNDSYLELIYPHLKLGEMAGCLARAASRTEAAELFEWLIDACPLVQAFIPYQEARQVLAQDLLAAVPDILPQAV